MWTTDLLRPSSQQKKGSANQQKGYTERSLSHWVTFGRYHPCYRKKKSSSYLLDILHTAGIVYNSSCPSVSTYEHDTHLTPSIFHHVFLFLRSEWGGATTARGQSWTSIKLPEVTEQERIWCNLWYKQAFINGSGTSTAWIWEYIQHRLLLTTLSSVAPYAVCKLWTNEHFCSAKVKSQVRLKDKESLEL